MLEFGRALPRIRRRVAKDLRGRGLPKEKVLATIVRLLECTLIRVGNEEYARANGSFGLTTLRDRHVEVKSGALALEFRGKSGIQQRALVTDRRIARIVRDCRDIPGSGAVPVGRRERRAPPHRLERRERLSARCERRRVHREGLPNLVCDGRGARAAAGSRARGGTHEAKKQVLATVKAVSEKLGNTPAICRKCYIHPEVLSAHEAGRLTLRTAPARRWRFEGC